MKVDGKHTRSIWVEADGWSVGTIDQTALPHRYATMTLRTVADAARAIASMQVRGAALIATRPTAVNLKWALDEMCAAVRNRPREDRMAAAYRRAGEIADEDVAINQAIGRNGLKLIAAIAARNKSGERVNVLTHCNAGWLATVDWGPATAPIYMAHAAGPR